MSSFSGNAQETLVYWCRERERVRLAKEAGEPKPWSSDSIFQRTYFCNIRREDDRVTKWIRQNWSPEKLGWEDYEYAMVLARFLNWPETLEKITYCLNDPQTIWGVLEAQTGKIWGNAYVVTTHGLKMSKIEYLCDRVLPAAYEALGAGRWRGAYQGTPTQLAQRHGQLMQLEGLASFMAAQVVADLKNTPYHPLAEAEDWLTWAAPGPGSMRGLEWFFGEKVPESKFMPYLTHVREYLRKYDIDLHAQDVQNCLCEYDKYMRVMNGTGRSKRNYPGV